MSELQHIRWEITGNAGIITLDNPPQNVLMRPDILEPALLLGWAEHPDVNGLIICGEGRHFSAGADLGKLFGLAGNTELLSEKMQAGKEFLTVLENLDIPVIAAIKGVCFGGGIEIALACHLRICSQTSLFAFPEVNHNLMPGLGGTLRLPRITGESTALEILLTGDTLNASRALQTGLVDHCVPQNEVMDFSRALMQRMVGGKIKKVVRHVMKAWHNSRNLDYKQALKAETALFAELAADELQRRQNT
jgi:enoyl-CoA hydratase/carnithine racemase